MLDGLCGYFGVLRKGSRPTSESCPSGWWTSSSHRGQTYRPCQERSRAAGRLLFLFGLQYSTVLSILTGGIDGSSAHVHHFTVRCARRASCFAAAPRHLMLHARCALYVACQLDAVRAALLATSSRPHDALGRPGRACLLQPHLIGHYVYGVRVCARVWRGRGDS